MKSNHAKIDTTMLWPLTASENRRYTRTMDFMQNSEQPVTSVLDLGAPNRLGEIMKESGIDVVNTSGDLDLKPEAAAQMNVDAVTAFEILEHLVAPFNVLRAIRAPRLFATVPLRLWFASSYRNPDDPWDRHFHEFEDWQFEWLLEKSGWHSIRLEKWNSPIRQVGIRPLLRVLTPRYLAVEAIRREAPWVR